MQKGNDHNSAKWVWLMQARDQSHQLPKLSQEKKEAMRSWIYSQLANEDSKQHKQLLLWALYAFDLLDEDLIAIAVASKKKELQTKRKESGGSRCPCCDQYVKEYKRTLSANMCNFLQSLVVKSAMDRANGGEGWVHFKDCAYGSHDYPYVRDWLLAERAPSTSTKKKSSGMYRPTKLGIDFVFGRAQVPKYIFTYNGKRTGEDSSEMISFKSVKIEHFDLEKMLGGIAPTGSEPVDQQLFPKEGTQATPEENHEQGSLFDQKGL